MVQDIMIGFSIHTNAESDIRGIARADPDGASYITEWLQEAAGDQRLLDDMCQVGEYSQRHPDDWVLNFSTKPWRNERNRNLWRLRFLDLEDEGKSYRLIFGFVPRRKCIYVLGVCTRREMDYDGQSDFRDRIGSDYDGLC